MSTTPKDDEAGLPSRDAASSSSARPSTNIDQSTSRPSTSQDLPTPSPSTTRPRNSQGWDGKLRVDKRTARVVGPGMPRGLGPTANDTPGSGDSDISDDAADTEAQDINQGPPVEQIEADEDLLEDYEPDTDDIDLVHRGISSIPALRLERFSQLERLCLRQNQINRIDIPSEFAATLRELDLYDNSIGHIRGLELFTRLTSLDLSFNRIKHIQHLETLTALTDLYFVQNRITKIENLDTLVHLRNLELGANRIREIENLDKLTALEELWLGKNKITQLQNLDALSNLRILSIQSNRLTSLQGLPSLPHLEELYVSHNSLTSLDALAPASRDSENASKAASDNVTSGQRQAQCPNLRVLDVSNNQLSTLDAVVFQPLTHLEEVWASNNQLESFDEVEKALRDKAELQTVYLEGNPLQRKNAVLYRNKVRLALPQVKQIDATFVNVS